MSSLFNLLNCKIGKLFVKSRAENYKNGNARWLCVCDCGREIIAKGIYLKKGTTKCCPYCAVQDFTGQKIGKLKVIRRLENKIGNSGEQIIQWECQCDCGEIVTRRSSHLKRGRCCCLKCKSTYDSKNNFKGCGEMSGIFWCNIKTNAKRNNREFNITKEYAWNLFLEQNRKCALSGIELIFAKNKKEQQVGISTASLDRIDSSKGYVEGNVQWVHKWINLMKNNLNKDELLYYCKKIVEYNQ